MSRGDHIFVQDSLSGIPFQHHGIDMGDGTVIHLAPNDGARVTLRDQSDRFAIRRDTLQQFAGGRTVQVWRHENPRSATQVASTAESMLGQSGYSLLNNNCEHFASWCATGDATSQQIDVGQASAATIVSAANKLFWNISARVGTQAVIRGATKMHPAVLLADGVEFVTISVGCRRGWTSERTHKMARATGNLAAVGIGALVGGPVGAAVGLATHNSSRALANRICVELRNRLG